jgi:hypothetical protein
VRCSICDKESRSAVPVHIFEHPYGEVERICTKCITGIYPDYILVAPYYIDARLNKKHYSVARPIEGDTEECDVLARVVAEDYEKALYGAPRPPSVQASGLAHYDSTVVASDA